MHAGDIHSLRTAPFTSRQAAEAGVSRSRLAAMIKDRSIRPILFDVYASAHLEDTLALRVTALSLVVRPFVVVCDRAAAWLYGVDTLDYFELDAVPPVDTCVAPAHTRVRRRNCKGRQRELCDDDVQRIGSIQVTTPLRTAMDLGRQLSRRDALACLDAFARSGLVAPVALHQQLPRYAGKRGVIQLRELVTLVDAGAESPSESWTRLCLIDAGLPVPHTQWVIEVNGQVIFRLDLAYPKHKVAIEYDGLEFHQSEEAQRHDEARRQWLRDHGWTVIVVGKNDFDADSVARWTNDVRLALGL